ncbi:hypothetical protein DM813_17865 [Pseudomonas alkylphenolica]|uniref:Uncharacterized protein n=1 Tax=Pseudomonas alkylphenolica TaxID=237609 RepID=A0A443ZPQ6_9PSED|nr:hypothetical protein [Pseudomonas alkylphenolica]RWU21078.1 hypothetical protein DM813_17865 [Pseudomonas alkylphenolica]
MAMFELEDSDDVKIVKCRTDSAALIKGKGLNGLEVEECEADYNSVDKDQKSQKVENSELPPAPKNGPRAIGRSTFNWIMAIIGGVVVAGIARWLGFS